MTLIDLSCQQYTASQRCLAIEPEQASLDKYNESKSVGSLKNFSKYYHAAY